MLEVGNVIEIHPGEFHRVDFVNYARAFVVPLNSEPRTIKKADGSEIAIGFTTGTGFNISPNSVVRVVPTDELPAGVRAKLAKKV